LGIAFADGRIAPGSGSSPATGLGADDTARRDIVMMDDFLHGEPQAIE
jgi:hypothetical protein